MNTTNKPPVINPLAEGQIVIIIARFVLVAACLILIIMDARSENAAVSFTVTRFEIMGVLMLAVSNFYLVSQVMTKRKTMDIVIYGVSLADLAVISAVVVAQGGFASGSYIFYFPAMLAFALAFPMLELSIFLGATVSVYGFIGLVSLGFTHNTPENGLEVLMVRLLMLTAVAVCGHHFAQIERNRRNAILSSQFMAQEQAQVELPTQAMPQQPVSIR